MSPVLGKVVFVSMILSGAGVVQAHALSNADARASAARQPSFVLASSEETRTVAGIREDAGAMKSTEVASNSLLDEPSFGAPSRSRAGSGKTPALEMKEWMLIGIGVFLVVAMSNRRSRSMSD